MFGFVQDLYYGQVRTRISLLQFFQKVAPQLKKTLSKVLIRRCQTILQEYSQNKQSLQNISQKNKIKIGLHQRKIEHVQAFQVPQRFSSPQNNFHNHTDNVKSDIERLLQKNFNQNLEVEVQEENKEIEPNDQEQIVNYLKENRPKQRGWLQRLSLKKTNKWSLLFFQIDQQSKILKAVKPQSIKKIIEINQSDFELILNSDFLNKGHRKTNSLNQNQSKLIDGKPVLTQQKDSLQCQFQQACQTLAHSQEYLSIMESNQKPIVLRSFDVQEILKLIKETKKERLQGKRKNQNLYDEQLTFSGLVSLAFAQEKEIDKIAFSIPKLIFKDFLLVLKSSKMIFYGVAMKNTFDLDSLHISNNYSNLPFVPSHPFPFQITHTEKQIKNQQTQKIENKQTPEYPQVKLGGAEEQPEEDQGSVVMWQIDEDDQEDSDNEQKKKIYVKKTGFFDQFLSKFKKNNQPKVTTLTFAAESELKRRQWIFSVNYYKQSQNKEQFDFNLLRSNKSSYVNKVQSSQQNPSFSQTPLPSQYNQSTPIRSCVFRSLNNNQIFIGGNHTHINMNLFSLGNDDDYYDIFKDNQQRQKSRGISPEKDKDPYCHTDPNENKQNQQNCERLITLPSKNLQIKNNHLQSFKVQNQVINSTTQLELWQKFLIRFFKYLSDSNRQQLMIKGLTQQPQKSQDISEEQEPSVQRLYTLKLQVSKQK